MSLVPNVPLPLLSRQERPLAAHLVLPTPTRRPLAASSLVWAFLVGSGILDTALGSSAPGFCTSRWSRVLWSPPVWGSIAVPLALKAPLVLPSRQERQLAAHLVPPAPTLRQPAASPVWTYLAGSGVPDTALGSRAPGSLASCWGRVLWGPPVQGPMAVPLTPSVPLVILSRLERPLAAHLVLPTPMGRSLAASLVWTYLASSEVLDTAVGSRAPGPCASRWSRALWGPPALGPIAVPLVPNVTLVLSSRLERPLAALLVLPTPPLLLIAASLVWMYLAGSGVLDTVMGSRALGSWAPGGGREHRGPRPPRTCTLRGTVARVIQTYS